MKNAPSLAVLLVGGLALWAIACFILHGPVILAYIAIQAATSGVFALEMKRIQKKIPVHATDGRSNSNSESATRAA